VVLTREAHLITNAHVVAETDVGTVEFSDGTIARFDVVGRDPLSDIAVIRSDREIPTPPKFGDAGSLLVGSLVVAVGNPLGLSEQSQREWSAHSVAACRPGVADVRG